MATTTYEPIQTYTLGSTQATVTFSSIPSTYTDLILQMTPKTSDGSGYFQVFPNNDTGSNYSRTVLQGNGSSASSNKNSNSSNGFQMNCATSSQDANSYPTTVHLMNYANTNTNKTAIARAGSTSVGLVENYVWLYRSTSAITSLVIKANTTTFAAGSIFTLYGIANAQIEAPKATGGTITYDSEYFYHTFGASGTFTPQQSLTADILVVAGGGGGGAGQAGGGGAGGLLPFTSQSLTATNYTITVGAGGAGSSTSARGINGNDSQFGGLTLVKGGGGGGSFTDPTSSTNTGAAGGSGGGGATGGQSNNTQVGGAASPSGQGNAGGSGQLVAGTWRNGGGGGGIGGAGVNAAASAPTGTGGSGSGSTYSSWASATGTGVSGAYAGGGGGGGNTAGTATAGGGRGGDASAGTNGTANTGGGGGGGGYSGTANGYSGGSGVIIVRYPKA
jgi:hypothetical protein